MKKTFVANTVSMEELISEEVKKGEEQMDMVPDMNYAMAIEKELEENHFFYRSKHKKDGAMFDVMMPSDKLHMLRIKMIVDDDGDTKLRCYLANEIDTDKVLPVMKELNHLNSRFRFVCLSIDEDRDLCVANDFILFGDPETAVHQAVATLVLFADIADKCVPALMPLIWKNDQEKDEPVNVKTSLFGSEGGAA